MEPIPAPPLSPTRGPLWTRRQWLGASLLGLGLAAAGCRPWNRATNGRSIRILVRRSFFSEHSISNFEKNEAIDLDHPKRLVTDLFEEETGIAVEVETFVSDDELVGRLSEPGSVYDLAMPSGYAVRQLSDLKLLKHFTTESELITRQLPVRYESEKLPNLRFVDSNEFALNVDPRHSFSVPYLWSTTGIGYNAKRVDRLPTSWADLFTAATRRDQPKVAMLDDSRDALCTTLLAMAKLPNTRQAAEIEAAGDLLISLRERIIILGSEEVQDALRSGHVDLAMAWSGDVSGAMRDNPDIRLALPQEGSIKSSHYFVVPESAKNQEDAETFLNYLLRPQVAADVSNYSSFANTLPSSRPYVDRFIRNSAAYFTNPQGRALDWSLNDTDAMAGDFARVWLKVKQAVG